MYPLTKLPLKTLYFYTVQPYFGKKEFEPPKSLQDWQQRIRHLPLRQQICYTRALFKQCHAALRFMPKDCNAFCCLVNRLFNGSIQAYCKDNNLFVCIQGHQALKVSTKGNQAHGIEQISEWLTKMAETACSERVSISPSPKIYRGEKVPDPIVSNAMTEFRRTWDKMSQSFASPLVRLIFTPVQIFVEESINNYVQSLFKKSVLSILDPAFNSKLKNQINIAFTKDIFSEQPTSLKMLAEKIDTLNMKQFVGTTLVAKLPEFRKQFKEAFDNKFKSLLNQTKEYIVKRDEWFRKIAELREIGKKLTPEQVALLEKEDGPFPSDSTKQKKKAPLDDCMNFVESQIVMGMNQFIDKFYKEGTRQTIDERKNLFDTIFNAIDFNPLRSLTT